MCSKGHTRTASPTRWTCKSSANPDLASSILHVVLRPHQPPMLPVLPGPMALGKAPTLRRGINDTAALPVVALNQTPDAFPTLLGTLGTSATNSPARTTATGYVAPSPMLRTKFQPPSIAALLTPPPVPPAAAAAVVTSRREARRPAPVRVDEAPPAGGPKDEDLAVLVPPVPPDIAALPSVSIMSNAMPHLGRGKLAQLVKNVESKRAAAGARGHRSSATERLMEAVEAAVGSAVTSKDADSPFLGGGSPPEPPPCDEVDDFTDAGTSLPGTPVPRGTPVKASESAPLPGENVRECVRA
jgi:hypothetical protein